MRSSDNQNQLKRERLWRVSKAQKLVIVGMIIAILIVSAFGFLLDTNSSEPNAEPISYEPTASPSPSPTAEPTARPTSSATPRPIPTIAAQIYQGWQQVITPAKKGLIEAADSMNSTVWKDVAKNAWDFFTPGRGVDPTTGLPASSFGWNYFTDWDLGVYIQAVIDAQKIGLITKDGDWGSHARLEKVMVFLENRPLINGTIPYWFYSVKGEGYLNQSIADVCDTGTLLVALNNLKKYDPSFTSQIDNFVYNNDHNGTDYSVFVPVINSESVVATSIYNYYMTRGFESFFPALSGASDRILQNIQNAGTVKDAYNSTLPKASISCDPLILSFFNLNYNSQLAHILNQTYLAHEARYNATNEYVAFSEGLNGDFIYEWVVFYGKPWVITASGDSTPLTIDPVVYTKVSLSFLAIYNSTFAKDMSVYLEKVFPSVSGGYYAGASYSALYQTSKVVNDIGCNTNGLIITAARYAIIGN